MSPQKRRFLKYRSIILQIQGDTETILYETLQQQAMEPAKAIMAFSTDPEFLYDLQSMRIVAIPEEHITYKGKRSACMAPARYDVCLLYTSDAADE